MPENLDKRDSAPPAHAPHESPNKGSNQVAVRSYNARLIVQLIRWHGTLTNPQIVKLTGLSANAVSVIIRSLDEAELIVKGAPIRGRIGQPSTPVRLNPKSRHYFGLKIGRRSTEIVLIDFLGGIVAQARTPYRLPEPGAIRDIVGDALPRVLRAARVPRRCVHGLGIAMPSEIWNWAPEIGVSAGELDIWRDLDPAELLPSRMPWTPMLVNDATAACLAETTFASTGELQDALYLYIGTLVGGGVMLNGSVFFGRTGNAGGLGPFRVPGRPEGQDRLMDCASLIVLERMLEEAGHDPEALVSGSDWESVPEAILKRWIDLSGYGIAHAIASSLSIIDFQAVTIDGDLPAGLRDRVVDAVRSAFMALDQQGLSVPDIRAGKIGPAARAVGAAALPLNEAHSINQNTLLRT